MLLDLKSFLTQSYTLWLINLSHFLIMHQVNSHTCNFHWPSKTCHHSGLPCSCHCFLCSVCEGLIIYIPQLKAKTRAGDIWNKPQFSSLVRKGGLFFIFYQGWQHTGWLYLKSIVAAVQIFLYLTNFFSFLTAPSGLIAAENRADEDEKVFLAGRRIVWGRPSASFPRPTPVCRVARDQLWNAAMVAKDPHTHHTVNQNPKLHFIRLLSLQRLSHHSINTPSPPSKFVFPLFLYTWKCSRTVPAFWCGSLFRTSVQETTQ